MSYLIYISNSKLDLLGQEHGKRIWDAFQKVSLRLKAPFVEGDFTAATAPPKQLEILRRVERRIIKEMDPPEFHTLREKMPLPPFVTFHISLARLITREVFWGAGASMGSGLLLAGSSQNVIGTTVTAPEVSASVDTIGAISRVVDENAKSVGGDADLSRSCSFMWQSIYRHNHQDTISLPVMRGLAITAAVVKADPLQTRRAKVEPVDRLIISTPLFVEQV